MASDRHRRAVPVSGDAARGVRPPAPAAPPAAAHHPATAAAVRRDLYVYPLNGTEPEKDKLGEMADTWPA